MSRDHGRVPHPAARGSSVGHRNKPREGEAAAAASGSADPQAAHSTACTGRATEQHEPRGPLLGDGRRGHIASIGGPEIAVRDLPPAERRCIARGMKALAPDLVAMLQTDPVLAELREQCDAYVTLTPEEYRRYYAAGRQTTEE